MTLIDELNKLVENGVKIRDIEAAVNFPKNQLSAILKKHKKLPKKWEDVLAAYVSLQDFTKRHTIELPKDFIGFDKVALLKADGTVQELKTIDELPPDWVKKYFEENPDKLVTTKSAVRKINQDMAELGVATYKTTETGEVERIDPLSDKGEILQQIAAIKAEKIPAHRDTLLGKKSWQAEQQKRISELQNKLK